MRTGIKQKKMVAYCLNLHCLLVLYWPVVLEVLATGTTITFSFLEYPTDV